MIPTLKTTAEMREWLVPRALPGVVVATLMICKQFHGIETAELDFAAMLQEILDESNARLTNADQKYADLAAENAALRALFTEERLVKRYDRSYRGPEDGDIERPVHYIIPASEVEAAMGTTQKETTP